MADIARYYDETKNPLKGTFPGVPLADIDQEAFDSYDKYIQESIDAHPMYRKTPVRHEKPADKKDGE